MTVILYVKFKSDCKSRYLNYHTRMVFCIQFQFNIFYELDYIILELIFHKMENKNFIRVKFYSWRETIPTPVHLLHDGEKHSILTTKYMDLSFIPTYQRKSASVRLAKQPKAWSTWRNADQFYLAVLLLSLGNEGIFGNKSYSHNPA